MSIELLSSAQPPIGTQVIDLAVNQMGKYVAECESNGVQRAVRRDRGLYKITGITGVEVGCLTISETCVRVDTHTKKVTSGEVTLLFPGLDEFDDSAGVHDELHLAVGIVRRNKQLPRMVQRSWIVPNLDFYRRRKQYTEEGDHAKLEALVHEINSFFVPDGHGVPKGVTSSVQTATLRGNKPVGAEECKKLQWFFEALQNGARSVGRVAVSQA